MSLANWFSVSTTLGSRRPVAATAQNPGQGVVADASQTAKEKEKKAQDSLFGPNIGVVSSGPSWTNINSKKVLSDELTQDVVKGWIEKSKEASQPTTTLQALVNLKRPTIRLSPLTNSEDDSSHSHHHHGLEFEYDCDAPKCGIYVSVLLPASHPEATTPSANKAGLSKVLVFESVVDGGFGRTLKLEEGAILELGRFENGGAADPSTSVPASADQLPTVAEASSTADVTSPNARNGRKRFTIPFRKRTHTRSVSGPALAVVDAEPSASPAADAAKKDDTDADGIRVTIRIAALDEHSTELVSPNEQVTYLHIVRFGADPPPVAEGSETDDIRPWVVKVVKREATIGPHTFHLHEIYGLTSAANSTPAPTAEIPTTPHSYPPASPTTAIPLLNHTSTPLTATAEEDSNVSECLVCLSSPREVVLLPCRHLVACKDCALNMVEFGAGGAITQAEEPVATPDGAAEGDEAVEGEPSTATPATAHVAAPTTTRRKRKAKGWFCPVCRQPYSSMLRITTTPPPPPTHKESEETVPTTIPVATPEVAVPEPARTGGLLSGGFRPTFLRNLSTRGNATGNQRDLESQT